MHEEKLLIRILHDLAKLVSDEAAQNPKFAQRLENLLADVPRPQKKKTSPKLVPDEQLPDVFAEAQNRSVQDFELWLATLDTQVLKALVRKHELDSSKRTRKWTEPEKFAKLISDQVRARMERGSAFLNRGSAYPPPA